MAHTFGGQGNANACYIKERSLFMLYNEQFNDGSKKAYLVSRIRISSSIKALPQCLVLGCRQGSGVRRNVHVTVLKLGDIWENDRSVLLPGIRMGPPDGLGSL